MLRRLIKSKKEIAKALVVAMITCSVGTSDMMSVMANPIDENTQEDAQEDVQKLEEAVEGNVENSALESNSVKEEVDTSTSTQEEQIISIQPIPDYDITEGTLVQNLPLPFQVFLNTNERENLMGRLNIYPNNDGNTGWVKTTGPDFENNMIKVGQYKFDGILRGLFIDDTNKALPSNPENLQPEVNINVKEARVVSCVIPGQVSPAIIDEANRTIDIRVQKGTDLSMIHPIVTLSDYTVSSLKDGEGIDLSSGTKDFTVKSERTENEYQWKLNVSEGVVQKALFVSPTGSDSNDGSESAPFKTLEKAKEYVRTINDNMTGDIMIYLREGTYLPTKALELNGEDSGTNGYSIVYTSYPGETAVVSGGKNVEGWAPVEGMEGVYRAPAPEGIEYSRDLYVNGRRATVAKEDLKSPWGNYWYDNAEEGYPKAFQSGSKKYTVHQGYKTDKNFKYNDMINWKNQRDIEFSWKIEWTHHIVPVDEIIPNGSGIAIKMRNPAFEMLQTDIGPTWLAIKFPHIIQNALPLLNEPGESYFDREEKYVYYMPREGEDIENITAEVSNLDDLIVGNGTKESPISNITFKGIDFENTSNSRPNSDLGVVGGQASFTKEATEGEWGSGNWNKMKAVIRFDYANNVIFDECGFKKIGQVALDFNKAPKNNIVTGCTFDGVASNSIQIGEVTEEAKYNLEDGVEGNKILSNKIYNTGETFNGSIGIWHGFGKDTIIAHNDINHGSYSGISSGWSWGYDAPSIASNVIIEDNHIRNVLQKLNDGGGIYTLGYQPGSRISGNYVHDNKPGAPGGIYLDEGSGGYTDITNNVVHSVSSRQPDCFYLNRDVGYWGAQPDKAQIVNSMNSVMDENFPHNKFTSPHYSAAGDRPNPDAPDMSIDYVRETVENAGIHMAYKYDPNLLPQSDMKAEASNAETVVGDFGANLAIDGNESTMWHTQFSDPNVIPQKNMKVTANSEETVQDRNGAVMAIDGKEDTLWTSNWSTPNQFPFEITLDLGEKYSINKYTYLGRKPGINGNITEYELQVSTDGENFTTVSKGNWADDGALKVATFDETEATHVKLIAHKGVGGFAAASELNVFKVNDESSNATLPQSLTLDLGGKKAIDKYTYLPRQSGGLNGNITKYELQVSTDGENFTTVTEGKWLNNSELKTAKFSPVEATHVRLIAHEGTGGVAAAAEVNVYKTNKVVEEIVVGKPSKLKANNVTTDTVELNWEASKETAGLIGYVVYKDGKIEKEISADTTEYTATDLSKNTIYGFKVASKYSNGQISKPVSVNVRTKK